MDREKREYYLKHGLPRHVLDTAAKRAEHSGGAMNLEDALIAFLGAGAIIALPPIAEFHKLKFVDSEQPIGEMGELIESGKIDGKKMRALFTGDFTISGVDGGTVALLCATPRLAEGAVQMLLDKQVMSGNYGYDVGLASRDLISTVFHRNFSSRERLIELLRQLEKVDDPGAIGAADGVSKSRLLSEAVVQLFAYASFSGASDAMVQLLPSAGVFRIKVSGVSYVAAETSPSVMQQILNVLVNSFAEENASILNEKPLETVVDFVELNERESERSIEVREAIKSGANLLSFYRYRLQLAKPRPSSDPSLLYVVFRVVRKEAVNMSLDQLGFGKSSAALKTAVHKREGLVLFAGATGSGKTTTADALIGEIDAMRRWVFSLENPIEFVRPLINQHEVRSESDYAEQIKSFLRCNPDVCFFGECRDGAVAKKMTELALTGSLVISTLHSANAPAAIQRLRDWGLDNNTIAETLLVVIGQRLYPRLCEECKVRVAGDALLSAEQRCTRLIGDLSKLLQSGEMELMRASLDGCDKCHGLGFSGQWLVHEILPINDVLRKKIATGADIEGMREYLIDGSVHAGIAQGLRQGLLDTTTVLPVLEEMQA